MSEHRNGKGSSPRNIFSTNWRSNYDHIDWSETWFTAEDNVLLQALSDGTDYVVPKGTIVKIKGSTVYTFNNPEQEKIVELNMTPAFIRNSGKFTKNPPQ